MKWDEKEFNRFAGYRSCESFLFHVEVMTQLAAMRECIKTIFAAYAPQQLKQRYLHANVVG